LSKFLFTFLNQFYGNKYVKFNGSFGDQKTIWIYWMNLSRHIYQKMNCFSLKNHNLTFFFLLFWWTFQWLMMLKTFLGFLFIISPENWQLVDIGTSTSFRIWNFLEIKLKIDLLLKQKFGLLIFFVKIKLKANNSF
jgi:hypothetical protein